MSLSYVLDMEKAETLFKGVTGNDVSAPDAFLSEDERKRGTFPIFMRLMEAKSAEDIADITLDDVMSVVPDIGSYASYLKPKRSPLAGAGSTMAKSKSQCVGTGKRRVL